MGFPMGYSELPRLVLNLFLLLNHLRRLSSWLLDIACLSVEADASIPSNSAPYVGSHASDTLLARFDEHLPCALYSAVAAAAHTDVLDACAVCLHDFAGDDEVRLPAGRCHVFHRGCLDRWAALGASTCPLCRAPLLPPEDDRNVAGDFVGGDELLCQLSPS